MENNLPQRKEIRLKEYDYSQEGYYFITICTKNRKCMLSKIIDGTTIKNNAKSVGAGLVSARCKLTRNRKNY